VLILSFGILRIQKFSSGSVLGIQIHDKRAKDVSHTNKDIDFSKSEQNYDLYHSDFESYYTAVKNRIGQLNLKKAVRKDAKVMCQAMITSDKTFFERISKEQQEQYFRDSYDFICERYGKENIISAIVHMDERTPHLHVNFVPVTADGRLSAKDVIGGRKDLNELQTDFYEQVAKKYGLERGKEVTQEQREAGTARRHLSVADFKEATEREIEKLKVEISELESLRDEIQGNLGDAKALTLDKLAKIKPYSENTLAQKLGAAAMLEVCKKDWNNLLETAIQRAIVGKETKQIYAENKHLKSKINDLERKFEKSKKQTEITIQEKMEFAKLKSRLQNVPKIDLEQFLIQYDEDAKNAIYLQKLQKDDER